MINSKFLSIQGSYKILELSLYQNHKSLETITLSNKKASSALIPLIEELLAKHSITLSDLDFIGVDQGPGAFTSLRVTITTVNGISFAKKIPLIGIDGLKALSQENLKVLNRDHKEIKPNFLVSSLNAFNNEVFFDIKKIENNKLIETEFDNNYEKIDSLLEKIKTNFKDQKILFTGNGTILHEELILETLQDKAIILPNTLQVCSTEQIADMALNRWNKKENLESKLLPLYLKSQTFTVSK